MFISCSINDCPSRSGKSNNDEKVNFFSFPTKNPDLYQKWMASVELHLKKGHPLRKNLYICQRHFNESNFLRDESKVWKDGLEVIIQRKRLRLVKDAVPSIFTMPKECENSLPNVKSNAGTTNVTRNIESQPTLNSKPEVPHQIFQRVLSSNTEYSLEDLVRDWNEDKNNPLQQNWGMINSIGWSNSVYFGCCGDSTDEITVTRAVIVYSNMSTKLQVRARLATFPILQQISCFQDVISTLTVVACLRLCENMSCEDGYFQPIPHSSSIRCRKCQKQKRRKEENERAQAKRCLLRKEKQKEKKNLREETPRSVQKVIV